MKALGPVVLAALALTVTAAGAPTGTPGVTAKQILIGGTVPLSGQASAFGAVGPSATASFTRSWRISRMRAFLPTRPRR